MALATTSDYANFIYMLLWMYEETTGVSVGNLNQDGTVNVSPWAFNMLRYGYNPQDVTNYSPGGAIVKAWPEGISPTEAADETDITTIVTGYLTYKIARLGNDTNVVQVLKPY